MCVLMCRKMQRHMEIEDKINVNFDKELYFDMVLKFFPITYDQFILAYHLNNT